MGVEILDASGHLLTFRVVGKLKKSELDRMQGSLIDIIERHGQARLLVMAEDFQGWDEESDWGDISFQVNYDRYI